MKTVRSATPAVIFAGETTVKTRYSTENNLDGESWIVRADGRLLGGLYRGSVVVATFRTRTEAQSLVRTLRGWHWTHES